MCHVACRIPPLDCNILFEWTLRTVFFNPDSAEPRGFANSLLGSLKTLLGMLGFFQKIIYIQEVPRFEKVENHCFRR